MRRTICLVLLILNLLFIFGCENNKVNDLYIEIYNLDNTLCNEKDETNQLLLKKEIIYYFKVYGWNGKHGLIQEINLDDLNYIYDETIIYIEKDDLINNYYLFYSKQIGDIDIEFKYFNISRKITLRFIESNRGNINEDILLIPNISLLSSFNNYNSDIENLKVDIKKSPIDIEKYKKDYEIITKSMGPQTNQKWDGFKPSYYYRFTNTYKVFSNHGSELKKEIKNYITDEFKEDLLLLKKEIISVESFINKYGTDIITSTLDSIYLNIDITINDCDNEKQFNMVTNHIKSIILGNIKYEESDLIFKQVNLDIKVTSSFSNDHWYNQGKQLTEMINSKEYNYKSMILEYIPIWELVEDFEIQNIIRQYYREVL